MTKGKLEKQEEIQGLVKLTNKEDPMAINGIRTAKMLFKDEMRIGDLQDRLSKQTKV